MLFTEQQSVDRSDNGRFFSDIDTTAAYQELADSFRVTKTPLDVDFRKLVSWLRMGDQLTHLMHSYPAKLLPHIAHFFLNARDLHKASCDVLDPFCGSGTVALEASIAGYSPLVADANPLSILLTRVKTEPYDCAELKEVALRILQRSARYRTAPSIDIVNAALWYQPEKKKQLEIILRAINEEDEGIVRDFFLICFSSVARRLSYADPAVSVPVRLKTKPRFSEATNKRISSRLEWVKATSAQEEFKRCIAANIERVSEANRLRPHRLKANVVGRDARLLTENEIKVPDASIPLIITSPPYGSAQKYIRATSLSLNWLGLACPDSLAALESKSIGREHIPVSREINPTFKLPKKYETLLSKISKTDVTRAEITRRYLCEMSEVVNEITRVMAKGGRAVIVIGNNQVCGETLRNDDFIREAFERNSVVNELSLIDHIKSRGLMTKRNRTASVISRESVMVFKKG